MRSKRSGSGGSGVPSGREPASHNAKAARWRRARLRPSIVSSATPKPRLDRQRTSTMTSWRGGPGSIATRSSSARPTLTCRASTRHPTLARRAPTTDSASSPARCAGLRIAQGWRATLIRGSPRRLRCGSGGVGRDRQLARLAQDRLSLGDRRSADPARQLGHRKLRQLVHAVEPVELAELVRLLEAVDALVEEVEAHLVAGERPLQGEERAPVERGEPQPADRVTVIASGIALVVFPAVARIPHRKEGHHPVAYNLGNDRRAGDRVAPGIAVDDRRVRSDRGLETLDPVAVDQDVVVAAEAGDGAAHREVRRVVDVDRVDLADGGGPNPNGDRAAANDRSKPIALLGGEGLRVADA